MYCRNYTGTVSCVLCREVIILCPYLGESTIGKFTADPTKSHFSI